MKKLCLIVSLILATSAFADAPVVDLSQGKDESGISAQALPDQANNVSLSLDQRVNRLEQQMTNFSQMNPAARIDQLQQQVNQLLGQLEQQGHQIQQLQDQQKSFYQDIDQRLNQLKNTAPATTPSDNKKVNATSSASEQVAYQQAFALLGNKKYDQAAAGLNKYLQQYPQGMFAANAHYWLGEIYYLQNKPDLAAAQFETVIAQYPKDQKIPDAMLKLAFIHDNAGNHAQAKKELQVIIKQYSGTPAAQLASLRLKTLNSKIPQ